MNEILFFSNDDTSTDISNRLLPDFTSSMTDMMGEIVKEAEGVMKERNQRIVLERSSTPAIAWIDKETSRMVFENLVDNASKYSEENTTITITVAVYEKSVTVNVTDEGVGISDEDMSKLFEKFSRIHNPLSTQAGGSGLGLYWVKKIVDLHGGGIEVTSTPDKGTSFLIKLPRLVGMLE